MKISVCKEPNGYTAIEDNLGITATAPTSDAAISAVKAAVTSELCDACIEARLSCSEPNGLMQDDADSHLPH